MRFMVIVPASAESEAGVMPTKEMLEEMGKFNEQLIKAGVMLAGEGLAPSSQGARLKFEGKKRVVTDGPFAESKEMVGGFWIIQTKSLEEAIEWMKRAPFGDGVELIIRRVHEASDFGDEFSGEMRESEERWREKSGYGEKK